jgi:cytochrome bd ubiquinol oxidase subunit I
MPAAASPADLFAARSQMALSLGWHIVVACLGVGFPALVMLAEWRGLRTGDPAYRLLARRWARALGVLFAVGAVSGTILSFEMGILWPGLMGTFGEVIGLPFAIEGIAFFVEAIFLGIYLYGWDRLPPRAHLASGVPILLAGVASAFFVVCANAWMQQPRGFDLVNGKVTNVDPWAAMFNPATPPQTVHMILAAFIVAGFLVASVYAVALLRGRRDRYHRLGFLLAFTVAAAVVPAQSPTATGRRTSWPPTSRSSWPRWRGCSRPPGGCRCTLAGWRSTASCATPSRSPMGSRCWPTGTPTPRSRAWSGCRPPTAPRSPWCTWRSS